MKRIFPLLAFSLFYCSSFAQKPSLRALDEKNGFRDVQFGSDSSALSGRVLVRHEGYSFSYTRPSDKKEIGGATAQSITYTYYRGHLSGVIIVAEKGVTNAKALIDAFEAQYGNGLPAGSYSKDLFWQSKKIKMIYQMEPSTDTGSICIFGRAALEQQAWDEKAAAKKAHL